MSVLLWRRDNLVLNVVVTYVQLSVREMSTRCACGGLLAFHKSLRRTRLMSSLDSEKWAKLSKLGREQYVLRYGVLGWGVPRAILFSLIQVSEKVRDVILLQLIPALILFPLGGILVGRIWWNRLQKKHAREVTSGAK